MYLWTQRCSNVHWVSHGEARADNICGRRSTAMRQSLVDAGMCASSAAAPPTSGPRRATSGRRACHRVLSKGLAPSPSLWSLQKLEVVLANARATFRSCKFGECNHSVAIARTAAKSGSLRQRAACASGWGMVAVVTEWCDACTHRWWGARWLEYAQTVAAWAAWVRCWARVFFELTVVYVHSGRLSTRIWCSEVWCQL